MTLLLALLGLFVVAGFTLLALFLVLLMKRVGKERLFPFIVVFPILLLGFGGTISCVLIAGLLSSGG